MANNQSKQHEIEEIDREIASLQKFLSYEKEMENIVYSRLDKHLVNLDKDIEKDRFESGFFEYFSTNSQIAINRLECELKSLQDRRQKCQKKKKTWVN